MDNRRKFLLTKEATERHTHIAKDLYHFDHKRRLYELLLDQNHPWIPNLLLDWGVTEVLEGQALSAVAIEIALQDLMNQRAYRGYPMMPGQLVEVGPEQQYEVVPNPFLRESPAEKVDKYFILKDVREFPIAAVENPDPYKGLDQFKPRTFDTSYQKKSVPGALVKRQPTSSTPSRRSRKLRRKAAKRMRLSKR